MPRSFIPLTLALFAVSLLAVPAALAKGRHPGVVRVSGVCTQQSTSKLKLSRENRRIEVEFQVDQNRNGVPWKVTLRRNGIRILSFTARTKAPSGSFEIRRVIAGRFGTDRIRAIAKRAGETCRADSAGAARAKTSAGTSTGVGSNGHDAGDDNGQDPLPHA